MQRCEIRETLILDETTKTVKKTRRDLEDGDPQRWRLVTTSDFQFAYTEYCFITFVPSYEPM